MIVACTSCNNRFEAAGYRDAHCPACGALAQQASTRPCPRCELPLSAREAGTVVIDECTSCGGLFLDRRAVQLVIDGPGNANALLAALPRSAHHPLPKPGAKMYIKCPTCRTVMNRKQFASGAGVVVDVCKEHGTFFDIGELPAVLEFVQRGGLKRAEQKAKLDGRASQPRVTPASDLTEGAGTAAGIALVDLLFSLFG